MKLIFKLAVCAGMIRGKKGMFDRAIKVANWIISHVLTSLYFILLKILWITAKVKVNEYVFYFCLISLVGFVWFSFKKIIMASLIEAYKEVRQEHFENRIKRQGIIGVTLMFASGFITLIIGIFTVSDYKNW